MFEDFQSSLKAGANDTDFLGLIIIHVDHTMMLYRFLLYVSQRQFKLLVYTSSLSQGIVFFLSFKKYSI